MKNRHRTFLIINIVIPIVTGAVIYYLLSPGVDFVRLFDKTLGISRNPIVYVFDNTFIRLFRNYIPDMLWAYALLFSVYAINVTNKAEKWKLLLITMAFSGLLEVIQLTPYIHGTFDPMDIVVEFLAELIAALFISNFLTREEKYEEE